MKFTRIMMCCIFLVALAGCSAIYGDLDNPTPIPGNTAWSPVVQTINGVEMVLVPPGCFTMGNEGGRRDEQPEHQICFDKAYWIDRYEVTNSQYGSDGVFPGELRPRDNLTWFEARDFCASRGARLPTEAEWEYACSRRHHDPLVLRQRLGWASQARLVQGQRGQGHAPGKAEGAQPLGPLRRARQCGRVVQRLVCRELRERRAVQGPARPRAGRGARAPRRQLERRRRGLPLRGPQGQPRGQIVGLFVHV